MQLLIVALSGLLGYLVFRHLSLQGASGSIRSAVRATMRDRKIRLILLCMGGALILWGIVISSEKVERNLFVIFGSAILGIVVWSWLFIRRHEGAPAQSTKVDRKIRALAEKIAQGTNQYQEDGIFIFTAKEMAPYRKNMDGLKRKLETETTCQIIFETQRDGSVAAYITPLKNLK